MLTSVVIISKDERSLAATLDALRPMFNDGIDQVVVVDASEGRLDDIRADHAWVDWENFVQPRGVRITIPSQRNAGVAKARGDLIVFIDAGCIPRPMWLQRLLQPILHGSEHITCGPATARGANVYGGSRWSEPKTEYVSKAPTINMAFRREVFDAVGGFDERFDYGSDIDFTWRITASGERIRWISDAVVEHEWGTVPRQVKRAFVYGAASARLYRKHPRRIKESLQSNPVPFAYPAFLVGLPLTLRFRWYPLLLVVPLWRNRRADAPVLVLVDHIVHGAGVLAEMSGCNR